MKTITKYSVASITFDLRWESDGAKHVDQLWRPINVWRDTLPERLYDQLLGAVLGDRFETELAAGRATPPYETQKVVSLPRSQFNEALASPRFGRFYPQGNLSGLTGVYRQNTNPFRVIAVDQEKLLADLNHPLCAYPIRFRATVEAIRDRDYDWGGECVTVMEEVTTGPGMQARCNNQPSDFFNATAFARENEDQDFLFYQQPRLVNHIDDCAIAQITELYASMMTPKMDVLDLMSSWRSHMPAKIPLRSLVGLGMNAEEMRDNPLLTRHLVHDLNLNPSLPFSNASFDLVVCTVSFEYLTQPEWVLQEVIRVLRPGGRFVTAFSNRWFPPKVTRLWTELHEFERLGLVLEYFRRANAFTDLCTFSSRGRLRPITDKYFPNMRISDPVYAVWGRLSS